MPLRPLYGHHAIRARLAAAASDGRLPASLLLQGRRGVGKQRLALWLGQYLICERATRERLPDPCGECQHCRYAERGMHPDLHWFFPRPRLKDGDPQVADVKADLGEAIAERMEAEGLWAPPPGTDGLYIATIRALVNMASSRPAMAARTVFVVGDAERMVSQEGADQAANAFLKLLEEPPGGTTLILTTSEPGALLPTIKSRVVSVRVPALTRADMDAFLADAVVERKLARTPREELLSRASGAPGELFAGDSMSAAFANARALLEAALAPRTPDGTSVRIKAAARQGVAGARGAFSDTLDALTHLLHARTQQLVMSGRDIDARRTATVMPIVEQVKTKAQNNVSPNLLTASLLRAMHQALQP
jgi:DNA polymerase III subunit delta'